MKSEKPKSVQEMEEANEDMTHAVCLGVVLVFLVCACLYGFSILLGWLVAISMGG